MSSAGNLDADGLNNRHGVTTAGNLYGVFEVRNGRTMGERTLVAIGYDHIPALTLAGTLPSFAGCRALLGECCS